MSKILGLDLSSLSTGVAVVNNGRILKKSFELIQPNGKWSYGERLKYFESEIKRLIQKHKPDHIIIEDVFKGRNAKTFKILCMFRGVAIKAIFDETGKDPINALAAQARSILDIPNTKEDAFEIINNKYKLNLNFKKENDIVDAVVLALAAKQILKKGINEESLRSIGTGKKRKRKRNKKGV